MAYRLSYLGLWIIYLNKRTLYVSKLLEQSVGIIAKKICVLILPHIFNIGHMDTAKALESQRTVCHWREHTYTIRLTNAVYTVHPIMQQSQE